MSVLCKGLAEDKTNQVVSRRPVGSATRLVSRLFERASGGRRPEEQEGGARGDNNHRHSPSYFLTPAQRTRKGSYHSLMRAADDGQPVRAFLEESSRLFRHLPHVFAVELAEGDNLKADCLPRRLRLPTRFSVIGSELVSFDGSPSQISRVSAPEL